MKDLSLEEWLSKDQAVPFEYDPKGVSWADVECGGDISRQIRLEKGTDPDTVMRYAMAMEDGAEFPAICVVKDGKSYSLITGMHRREAAELANYQYADVYILKTDDPLVLERVRRTANVLNGRDQNKEERILQALQMIRLGSTIKQAAADQKLPYGLVDGRARGERVRAELLHESKVDPSDISGLPNTVLTELHKIPRKQHRARVAVMLAKTKVSIVDRDELIKKICDAETDSAVEKILADAEKHLSDQAAVTGGGKHANRRPFWSMPGTLTRINRMIDTWGESEKMDTMSANDRLGLADKCESTGENLLELAKALRDGQKGS
jgi:ParB-like chromosome segregation protein Spo0J